MHSWYSRGRCLCCRWTPFSDDESLYMFTFCLCSACVRAYVCVYENSCEILTLALKHMHRHDNPSAHLPLQIYRNYLFKDMGYSDLMLSLVCGGAPVSLRLVIRWL